MQPVIRIATKTVLWAAFLIVVGLVGAFLAIPKIMGWVPLAVLSGSMEPTLNPGDEIVVRPVTAADLNHIAVGDVITFLPYPDDPTVVTHRVVGVAHRSDGSVQFTTKGDANNAPDPNPVAGKQVRGTLLYHAPLVGRFSTLLPQGGKGMAVTLAAIALLAYGAWQIGSSLRSGSRMGHRGRHRATPSRQ